MRIFYPDSALFFAFFFFCPSAFSPTSLALALSLSLSLSLSLFPFVLSLPRLKQTTKLSSQTRMCLLVARREFEASANRLLLDLQRGATSASSALRDLRAGVGASAAALDSLSHGMSHLHAEQQRQAAEDAKRAAEALLRVEERAEGARLSAARAAEGGERVLARQSALRDLISGIETAQADRSSEATRRAQQLAEAVSRAALSAEQARAAQDSLVAGVREVREGTSSLSEMLRRSLNYQRKLESVLHARLFGRLEKGGGRFYLGSAAAAAATAEVGPARLRAAAGPATAALGAALGGELALDAVSFYWFCFVCFRFFVLEMIKAGAGKDFFFFASRFLL